MVELFALLMVLVFVIGLAILICGIIYNNRATQALLDEVARSLPSPPPSPRQDA
jgi:hypothetical protein